MPVIGKIELKSGKDVEKNTEITLMDLFPYEERIKEITLGADVSRDQAKLKVTVAKLGVIDSIADASRKQGEKAHLWTLMKYSKTTKAIKAPEPIKKDEMLAITVETA